MTIPVSGDPVETVRLIGKRKYPVGILWTDTAGGRSRAGSGRTNGWSFPRKVEKHLQNLTTGKTVLHLFGGLASWGTRLDIDPLVKPDVLGDAWLPPFAKDSFDVVILDPPYFRMNSQEKVPLLRAATWIAREHVIWFHTLWISSAVGLKIEQAWLVHVADNALVRCLIVYTVPEKKQTPGGAFKRGPAIKYNRWLMGNALLPFGAKDAVNVQKELTSLSPEGA
jgi:hypothetical protein